VADRIVSPSLDQLEALRQPLTDGERSVLQLFLDYLDDRWEIYIQPPMNGLCPDFVLMHPDRGIQIVEVKDWDPGVMPWKWQRNQRGYFELFRQNRQGRWFREKDDPVSKLRLYEKELTDLYCPRLGLSIGKRFGGAIPCLAACIAMPRISRARMEEFLRDGVSGLNTNRESRRIYWPFISADTLAEGNIVEAVPASGPGSYRLMREEFAADLRLWLADPDMRKEQRKPLELDRRQRELAETRTQTGYRRIRGAAGSGKSQVLGAKAANLAKSGNRVLIITFNITLCNYLRDLVTRGGILYGDPRVVREVTILNFHAWCKRVCLATGNAGRYYAIWGEGKDGDQPLNDALANLVSNVLEEVGPGYDAVLVDEGQDFRLSWWEALRKACKPAGEMLLVADRTQNLYGTASAWTDEAMTGAGFRGGWSELTTSYRMPPAYVPYIVDFANRFIAESDRLLPKPRQAEFPIDMHMRWIQTGGQTDDLCASEVAHAVAQLPDREGLPSLVFSDVVFMADTRRSGYDVVRKIGSMGIKVAHTFDLDDEVTERRRKMAFFIGSEKVKATTVHSFKGWESPILVLQIDGVQEISESKFAAVYAALTRLRSAQDGPSLITVVCSEHRLRDYGKTWPEYLEA
jgi:hypothetical protein